MNLKLTTDKKAQLLTAVWQNGMPKNIIFATIFILTFIGCKMNTKQTDTQTTNPSYQFRRVNWNMTKDEVAKNETAKPLKEHSEKSALFYIVDDFFKKKCFLKYSFEQDSLKEAEYALSVDPYMDKADELYLQIKETLISKYGKPPTDTIIWKGIYKNASPKHQDINAALLTDDVNLHCIWIDSITTAPSRRIIGMECNRLEINVVRIRIMNADASYFFKDDNAQKQKLNQNF